MPIVTIDGYRGSGSTEIGSGVANSLNARYVDQLVLQNAAKRIGVPVEQLSGRAGREHRTTGVKARIADFLKRWLDFYARNAMYADLWEGLVFMGHSKELIEQLGHMSNPSPKFVSDQKFIGEIASSVHELASSENVVIVGRGAGMFLKDIPNTLHVGLSASVPTRIIRNMRKHDLNAEDAKRFTQQTDSARKKYYRRFFSTAPEDATHYNLLLNTEGLSPEHAADLIVSTVHHRIGKAGLFRDVVANMPKLVQPSDGWRPLMN
jgi:cytidylate kinase